jgi:hypothetical protein
MDIGLGADVMSHVDGMGALVVSICWTRRYGSF